MRMICRPVWLGSFRRERKANMPARLRAWKVRLSLRPIFSSATRVWRAAEYLRFAFFIRRLPAQLLALYLSVEPAPIAVVTLESIGRAVEMRRFELTRRVTGAAIVVEIRVSVFGEDVEVRRETPGSESPAFRH